MKRLLLVGVLAAGLALSACSASPAARNASLRAYVASLGASSDLQVTLTARASGPSVSTKAEGALASIAIVLKASSPDGQPLSLSSESSNTEITVLVGKQTLLDARSVDSNLYVLVNPNAVSAIPGASVSSRGLALAQLTVGDRWYEITQSTIDKYVPRRHDVAARAAERRATYGKVIDALTKLVDTAPYTTSGNGTYSETGTLLTLEKALTSALGVPSDPYALLGLGKFTYTVSISTSGANATGVSVSLATPRGSGTVTAAFAHADDTVVAPSGATVITPALIASLAPLGFAAQSSNVQHVNLVAKPAASPGAWTSMQCTRTATSVSCPGKVG